MTLPCKQYINNSNQYNACLNNFERYGVQSPILISNGTVVGQTPAQCPTGSRAVYLSPDANGNYPSGTIYTPIPNAPMIGNMKKYCVQNNINQPTYCPSGTTKLANGMCETNKPQNVKEYNIYGQSKTPHLKNSVLSQNYSTGKQSTTTTTTVATNGSSGSGGTTTTTNGTSGTGGSTTTPTQNVPTLGILVILGALALLVIKK